MDRSRRSAKSSESSKHHRNQKCSSLHFGTGAGTCSASACSALNHPTRTDSGVKGGRQHAGARHSPRLPVAPVAFGHRRQLLSIDSNSKASIYYPNERAPMFSPAVVKTACKYDDPYCPNDQIRFESDEDGVAEEKGEESGEWVLSIWTPISETSAGMQSLKFHASHFCADLMWAGRCGFFCPSYFPVPITLIHSFFSTQSPFPGCHTWVAYTCEHAAKRMGLNIFCWMVSPVFRYNDFICVSHVKESLMLRAEAYKQINRMHALFSGCVGEGGGLVMRLQSG